MHQELATGKRKKAVGSLNKGLALATKVSATRTIYGPLLHFICEYEIITEKIENYSNILELMMCP